MKEKDFDYQNNNYSSDNEFFSFSDTINEKEDYSSFFHSDSISYSKEENPASEEISNHSDSNNINNPKPKVAPKPNVLPVILITAATSGGTVLGGVVVATSPSIDVSLFQSTNTSLVFEVKTNNLTETDEVLATLTSKDYELTYDVKDGTFVSFYELEENVEYTLDVSLNGTSKFNKKYITTGLDSATFIEINEYTPEVLSFFVVYESDYQFVTVNVYSGAKTYLISDQFEHEKQYELTDIDYTKPLIISVKHADQGLAYLELPPLEEEPPEEELTLTMDESSIEISSNQVSFLLNSNKAIDSNDIEVLLNDKATDDFSLLEEETNLYYFDAYNLESSAPYTLKINEISTGRNLLTYSFETPLEDLVITELVDQHDIGSIEATLRFETNRAIEDNECVILLNTRVYEDSTLVEDTPNKYMLEFSSLTPNTTYSLEIRNGSESGNALLETTFTTLDVEFEIFEYEEKHVISYDSAKIYFSTTKEIPEDLSLAIYLNDSPYNITFIEDAYLVYYLEFTSLPSETVFNIKVTNADTSDTLVEVEFETTAKPFGMVTFDDESNISISLTEEAYMSYQGNYVRIIDSFGSSVSSTEIEEQIVNVNAPFFKDEDYTFQIVSFDATTGDETVHESFVLTAELGYIRPVFTTSDLTMGEIRVTYESGYVPEILIADGNVRGHLNRDDNAIRGEGTGTIDPNSSYQTDKYFSIYLIAYQSGDTTDTTDINQVGYSGTYTLAIEDLNGVLLYKTNITI